MQITSYCSKRWTKSLDKWKIQVQLSIYLAFMQNTFKYLEFTFTISVVCAASWMFKCSTLVSLAVANDHNAVCFSSTNALGPVAVYILWHFENTLLREKE